MEFSTAEEIIREIVKRTGLPRHEVEVKIGRKKSEFGGLLTDLGAAFLVARELGLEIKLKNIARRMFAEELKPGDENVSLLLRVVDVVGELKYGKGKYFVLFAGDKTGIVRVVFWDKDVEKVRNIKEGDLILLEGAYAQEFGGGISVSLGAYGKVSINPPIPGGRGVDAEIKIKPGLWFRGTVEFEELLEDSEQRRVFLARTEDGEQIKVVLVGEAREERISPGDRRILNWVAIRKGKPPELLLSRKFFFRGKEVTGILLPVSSKHAVVANAEGTVLLRNPDLLTKTLELDFVRITMEGPQPKSISKASVRSELFKLLQTFSKITGKEV